MTLLNFALGGVTLCGILLLFSVFLKLTGGLYWFIPFSLIFIKDRNTERRIGLELRRLILKYIPPFFIGFLLIFLYLMFIQH